MAQTVKVRLRKPTQVFDFLVKDIPLEPGDGCVVRSERGLEYGVCTMPPEDVPPDEEKGFPMSVVRKATHHDETTYRQILADEQKAKALCSEKISQRNLPMHLVDVEYTFDHHKVVFYFTADERVDFRELVRDLAHELKTRIELRHIQVRDKAKIVGGIASCGRELCCATWMGDFMPISMKMAKRQNLSLNPSKISGQCGRLMCCLSYENHNYSDRKKKKPAAELQPQAAAAEDADDIAEIACGAKCAGCPAAATNRNIEDADLREQVSEWDDSVEDGENEGVLAAEDGTGPDVGDAAEDVGDAAEDVGDAAEDVGDPAEDVGDAAEDAGDDDDVEERTECGETVCVVDPESGEEITGDGISTEQRPRRKPRRRRKRRHNNPNGGQQPQVSP